MTRATMKDLEDLKGSRPQVWITAYDVWQAELAEAAGVDAILVGDSLGMTTLGYDTTLPVTVADIIHHARAVRRGAPHTPMVADLPFLSYRDPESALVNAGRMVQDAGADAVKLEGGERVAAAIERMVAEGIPVVGHIGLTPQRVHILGGFKVQARDQAAIRTLLRDAEALVAAGITALVLEGIPDRVAQAVTKRISKPTIGIGAGSATDGQVLVFHDCLGISARTPKFVSPFADGRAELTSGLVRYRDAVRGGAFPDPAHSYHIDPSVVEAALNPSREG